MRTLNTCPYCGSHNVQDRITEAQCLDCGSIDKFADTQEPCFYQDAPQNEQMQQKPEQWSPRQWDTVQQLQSRVIHVEKKLVEYSKQKRVKDSSY